MDKDFKINQVGYCKNCDYFVKDYLKEEYHDGVLFNKVIVGHCKYRYPLQATIDTVNYGLPCDYWQPKNKTEL